MKPEKEKLEPQMTVTCECGNQFLMKSTESIFNVNITDDMEFHCTACDNKFCLKEIMNN